jgi:hypothetical protein
MKFTVANDELKLKGKNGLYCFLPYENLDKNKKAVFKVGMTTQDFANRIENYHSDYPMGVYMVFFLAFNKKSSQTYANKKDEKDKIKSIEKELFQTIVNNSGERLKFPTRPSSSWLFPSEWFYTDVKTLQKSFEEIHEKFGGTLIPFHLDNISKNYKDNLNTKRDKYIAKIVYYV